MQQAKGLTEQVNYTGTKSPSKSEQNWGQGTASAKLASVSIVQVRHLDHDATLREEYETDLFEVDIKPEKYVQSVYSTSQNPHGTVVDRKFFSHLKLGVTKDLTKSIRVQSQVTQA